MTDYKSSKKRKKRKGKKKIWTVSILGNVGSDENVKVYAFKKKEDALKFYKLKDDEYSNEETNEVPYLQEVEINQ